MLCAPSITPPIPNAVILGDSISTSDYATGWPIYCAALPYGSAYRWTNFAVSGQRVDTMLANYPSTAGRFAQSITRTPWVLMVLGGNNDIAQGRTAAQIYADLVSIWTLGINAGARVIGMTVMPSTGFSAPQNVIRLALNSLITGDTTKYTRLYDASAAFPDPSLQPPYLDGTHLASSGNATFGGAINTILGTL